MKTRVRILVELLGPPAVGGTIAFVVFAGKEAQESMMSAFILSVLSVISAYFLAFVPSCLYALAMEAAFAAGLKKRSAGAVALSSGLGAIAGFSMGGGFTERLARPALIYGAIGFVTGLIISVLVAFFSKNEEPTRTPPPTDPSNPQPAQSLLAGGPSVQGPGAGPGGTGQAGAAAGGGGAA